MRIVKLETLLEENKELLQKFLVGKEDLPWDLYTDFYQIFCEEMPYGTAKGRTDDPYIWICERVLEELRGYEWEKK